MPSDIPDRIYRCWQLEICTCSYVLLCAALALVLRCVMAFFRALAVQRGDFPGADAQNTIEDFGAAYATCFHGFKLSKEHADLWLPFAIGFAELVSFPILIRLDAYSILGGWLLLKTAGAWAGWSQSRTSFNRFLFSTIMNVGLSYFWLSHYISSLCG